MKTTRIFTIFVFFALVCFIGFSCSALNDIDSLQGVWGVVSVDFNGELQPMEMYDKPVIITANRIKGLGPEMIFGVFFFEKAPKWIDVGFYKNGKYYNIHGIYDNTDDHLRICIPLAEVGIPFENKRPSSFETRGNGCGLFTMKRLKMN